METTDRDIAVLDAAYELELAEEAVLTALTCEESDGVLEARRAARDAAEAKLQALQAPAGPVHSIRSRRAWDLAPGEEVWLADGPDTVTSIAVDADLNGRPVMDVLMASGRMLTVKPWQRAHAVSRSKKGVPAKVEQPHGVAYPWRLFEAERVFCSLHEHWTPAEMRTFVVAYVEAKWPEA